MEDFVFNNEASNLLLIFTYAVDGTMHGILTFNIEYD